MTEACEAVVNTNAVITPDQFQSLKDSFGKSVNFHYEYTQMFSDEEPTVRDNITEEFVLDDFHFFTKPETDEKYLAFFDSKEEKWFPYFSSENIFSDMTILQCSKLTDAVGNVLWSFDNPP